MYKIYLVVSILFLSSFIFGQTEGTLTVSTMTSQLGGKYQPKNIVAVWIQDDSKSFVKTLLAYAKKRRKYLISWKTTTTIAGSSYNTVDAKTGATQSNHGVITCSWDGNNILSETVADGDYTVNLELTDKESFGDLISISFTKGPEPQTLKPSNTKGFEDIIVNWIPQTTSVLNKNEPDFTLYPNPVTNELIVNGDILGPIEIVNINGSTLVQTTSRIIQLNDLSEGVYFVKVVTKEGTFTKKILKK